MSYQSKLKAIREYRIWTNMKNRCLNPKAKHFSRYGGRGITICASWRVSFWNFLEDMGPCPTGLMIERKNNDGNYDADNCKWADAFEQSNNRSGLHHIEFWGERLTIAEWARRLNVAEWRVRRNSKLGRPLDAVSDSVKLSPQKVLEIRNRLENGESHQSIAVDYSVDRSTITAVSCGKNWKDAKNPRVEVEITEAI